MSLIRWLKLALPDVHLLIFDLHADLAFRDAEKKITSALAVELRTFGYIRYGFFNVTAAHSIVLHKAVCDALKADVYYLMRPDRPNVLSYRLFQKCYDRLWIIKSLVSSTTDAKRIAELHSEELFHLAEICRVMESLTK